MTLQCEPSRGRLANLTLDQCGRLRLQRNENGYLPQGEFLSEVLQIDHPSHITWFAQWTAPQHWQKCAGNPIYGPRKSGAWDHWTNGVFIVPTDGGQTYRMYYAGREGEGIGFAEDAVDDPTDWTELHSNIDFFMLPQRREVRIICGYTCQRNMETVLLR